MDTSNKFIRPLSTISLQRKLLLFIVIALSLIFSGSGIFIHKLVNDVFMESEKRHITIISESLSTKVGVWYFINNQNADSSMDEFLRNILTTYKLEYIAFRDKNGTLVSEVTVPDYSSNYPYTIEDTRIVYSPESDTLHQKIGTLQIGYGYHVLKKLTTKFYTVGILLAFLLILYFSLEMRLLKELLNPLRKIAAEIKGYKPGDKLVFKSYNGNKDDEIYEIVNGFLHMQQNVDDAIREKAIEEEHNKAKDAILMKQSRFIEMGTMINNIAHQWKQPLNIIELCITDLTLKSMMGTVDPEYQKKLFNDMHMQVAYMSKTIDIFKNFLHNDQSKDNIEMFSIKNAIEDTLQLLGSTFEKNNITVTLKLDETSCITHGSIHKLEQVILIILNNAIDAGSSQITVECLREKKDNIIKVYDNGGGFDPAIIDKLFDAYFTTKHQSQGTGLGLFIVKMIIEMKFNGTIEAKNHKDGALFIIRLPFHMNVALPKN
jgi:signal transduction histidine kinase